MSLLKFSGKGFSAIIAPGIPGDQRIDLSTIEGFGHRSLEISRSEDENIILTREEAIALRNYLNQICPSL